MSKPKNVHVGVTDDGKGEIHVWCISLRLKGSLPRQDGKVVESARLAKEREIQQLIEKLDF